MSTNIHNRALLVWLTVRTWSARKYDRTITEKVNRDMHATSDAGRYNKLLLPGDALAYKHLMTLAGQIRSEHYKQTLSWSDEGWRLLPTAQFNDYTDWYRRMQNEFRNTLRDEFLPMYPTMKAYAQSALNGAYHEEDYPDSEDIRRRFDIGVEYSPVPAEGDIRVDLASDQVSDIESAIKGRIERATETAMKDVYTRLFDVVSAMHSKLSQPEAIFRDSLIENARELCELLPRLNVTNDPRLDQLREQVSKGLTHHDPDILRDNLAVRANVAKRAEHIMHTLEGLYSFQQVQS